MLFVGTYLLSFYVLTTCCGVVPRWLAIPVLLFDILWVALNGRANLSRARRRAVTIVILTISLAFLFTLVCIWTIPV